MLDVILLNNQCTFIEQSRNIADPVNYVRAIERMTRMKEMIPTVISTDQSEN